MNQTDKYKVICNAIHPIRLLQMAYNSNNNSNSNYFNTDNQTYERLIRCFPIFASSIEFLNKIKDFIKSLKLDFVQKGDRIELKRICSLCCSIVIFIWWT